MALAPAVSLRTHLRIGVLAAFFLALDLATALQAQETAVAAVDTLLAHLGKVATTSRLTEAGKQLFADAANRNLDKHSFADAALPASGVLDAAKRGAYLRRIDALEAEARKDSSPRDGKFVEALALVDRFGATLKDKDALKTAAYTKARIGKVRSRFTQAPSRPIRTISISCTTRASSGIGGPSRSRMRRTGPRPSRSISAPCDNSPKKCG